VLEFVRTLRPLLNRRFDLGRGLLQEWSERRGYSLLSGLEHCSASPPSS